MCDVTSCDKKHFNVESDLMKSLLNRDTPIVYSPKIDSLLEKFTGELSPINPIPPGIHEADFDPKEDIRLDDQMFYDDTSSDDDSFEDIDYVEASPPDSELVSIEEVEDDILRAKLSNIYLLIAKIESFFHIYLLFYMFPHGPMNSGSSQARESVNNNKRFDCPDFEDSRARCFVHRSLALQILSMLILGI
ncbi:hypothetical protein Tco_0596901, partial [Tanacetum coccineum]